MNMDKYNQMDEQMDNQMDDQMENSSDNGKENVEEPSVSTKKTRKRKLPQQKRGRPKKRCENIMKEFNNGMRTLKKFGVTFSKQIGELKADNDEKTRQINELKTANDEKTRQINGLKNDLRSLRKQFEELKEHMQPHPKLPSIDSSVRDVNEPNFSYSESNGDPVPEIRINWIKCIKCELFKVANEICNECVRKELTITLDGNVPINVM